MAPQLQTTKAATQPITMTNCNAMTEPDPALHSSTEGTGSTFVGHPRSPGSVGQSHHTIANMPWGPLYEHVPPAIVSLPNNFPPARSVEQNMHLESLTQSEPVKARAKQPKNIENWFCFANIKIIKFKKNENSHV